MRDEVCEFFLGNHGDSERLAYSVLCELRQEHPDISVSIALAYMAGEKEDGKDYTDTFLPEGIENAPRRFAISYRNNWLLSQADVVVAYADHDWDGAAQVYEKVLKRA